VITPGCCGAVRTPAPRRRPRRYRVILIATASGYASEPFARGLPCGKRVRWSSWETPKQLGAAPILRASPDGCQYYFGWNGKISKPRLRGFHAQIRTRSAARDPPASLRQFARAMVVGAVDLSHLGGWVNRHYLLLIVERPFATQVSTRALTFCHRAVSALDDGCRC
jgi:hypothetical protein